MLSESTLMVKFALNICEYLCCDKNPNLQWILRNLCEHELDKCDYLYHGVPLEQELLNLKEGA